MTTIYACTNAFTGSPGRCAHWCGDERTCAPHPKPEHAHSSGVRARDRHPKGGDVPGSVPPGIEPGPKDAPSTCLIQQRTGQPSHECLIGCTTPGCTHYGVGRETAPGREG